ncbi:polysaccharide deacetylase family protein [Azospirillum sp. YIM B02556]|uniref:Chitooligosaccharide deacetylase n=1 Tax=Azospirillum endophyticum TaxID=2800326 RepID=A0ABS1FFU6_9PROT|nr:polysaccharide deacetylase family protein [Azospirillum endophyticum]MBK1842208.1 polysaccharide deacetylase family protein [Azospirillum endophyticum]
MKKVTLSFDNGPDPDTTPQVLDVLARHGLRTTFFVVGERLRDPGRRALCARARAEGHRIGNHTYGHIMPLGMSANPDLPAWEIGKAQDLIGTLSEPAPLFRPSGALGALNDTLFSRRALDYLVAGGYTCVLWNAVPRDWDDPRGWVGRALDLCERQSWPLVVLHDIDTGAMDSLDRFLDELAQRDMTVVQEFPPDCVPIVGGRIVGPVERYVAA